jgi:hypothetical protein
MNRKNFFAGMSALALIFAVGLASCATEAKLVKGTPEAERASLYLIDNDVSLIKIDGQKLGFAFHRSAQGGGFFSTKIKGTDARKTRDNEVAWSMDVTAGEHTITVAKSRLIGSKAVEGTYKFEGGKRYLLMVDTPSSFAIKGNKNLSDNLTAIGDAAKEEIAGIYILILAETYRGTDVFIDGFGHTGSKRELPRYPDVDNALLGGHNYVQEWINISPPPAETAE